ncbi:hypothetical protein [Streptomyces sp. NPDC053048]|uniref:hypothetical protein n=1 Tax=Streptomyces sp. NPDC053048 TaxID=3365694 RepID=UPI0037CFB818
MSKQSNGVTAARWNTTAVHSVGFLDREKRHPFSELLAAASEYFAEQEASGELYRVKDVRYRIGGGGVPILEVDVVEDVQLATAEEEAEYYRLKAAREAEAGSKAGTAEA